MKKQTVRITKRSWFVLGVPMQKIPCIKRMQGYANKNLGWFVQIERMENGKRRYFSKLFQDSKFQNNPLVSLESAKSYLAKIQERYPKGKKRNRPASV